MKISFAGIEDEPGRVMTVSQDYVLDDFSMGERNFVFAEPLHASLTLLQQEDNILVSGEIRVLLGMKCSRCLEGITHQMDISFDHYYSKEGSEVEGEEIDISAEVMEDIMLLIPLQPLCSEDCSGLCQKCGQNLNQEECGCDREVIDPRLVKLKEYFKD